MPLPRVPVREAERTVNETRFKALSLALQHPLAMTAEEYVQFAGVFEEYLTDEMDGFPDEHQMNCPFPGTGDASRCVCPRTGGAL